ncbi:glycosyltransferase family 39 protein [Nocardia caishijiensis]|uniref:4-amino-4-deoxy-L-arabinose transferase-like glycosyltransferase n=1 Tax=Nocardia caishijiensis TaxID=184756 RepID=A0ABQ6YMJ1_9NOCA|nr:glycosyltransferase family 39 protein [Nocardia caishijiensis]KAF0846815.1 4-amino-4-deoxy-L-arabinose transferase-like glycosyltransferase [Nocardia caishijiensis]
MTTLIARPEAEPAVNNSATRPKWEFPALAVLLIGTAVAYLCNLTANGWANSFYAAAVQAGSVSWKAFFFGSSDAANAITVDKTPAALWPMELSARLFGFSSWSMLGPQVLLGVASVGLLWATVRRYHGAAAGLLAGLGLALTPVAALMFRFNNPDALLVFLMIAAAWALLRATESGRVRWLVLCGLFMGFGFLAKQLQVLLVLPALVLVYLFAGPPKLGTRVLHLFAAGAAMVVGAGWWVLIAQLWPVDSRPYFGGSQNNSIIELTLGYNGLGRLSGNETGSVGPGGELPPGGNGMWGQTGLTRLFDSAQGGQIAWLLPAALILTVVALVVYGRAPRTDLRRASVLLWGGWLLVTAAVFSFMQGIFHQYYTVALAPAIAALTAIGAVLLRHRRERLWARGCAAATMAVTTATAWVLLSRTSDFVPWLRWVVLVGGIGATLALSLPPAPKRSGVAALLAGAVALAGPAAYTVETIASVNTGSIPSAGPDVRGGWGMPGGGMPEGRGDRGAPGVATGSPFGAIPGDGAAQPGAADEALMPGGGGAPNGRGDGGFLGGASQVSEAVIALLTDNADAYTWAAAATGSNSAATYQLATELPVMSLGGFNGSDPYPTLAQFQQYVADGRIHYFIGGGAGGPGARGDDAITAWVTQNFTAQQVDGVTVYDLTS